MYIGCVVLLCLVVFFLTLLASFFLFSLQHVPVMQFAGLWFFMHV